MENTESNVENLDDFEPYEIGLEFFDRIGNKTTKLVNNEDPNFSLKGKNNLFPFYFKEPIFVQDIEVELEGYSSTDKISFSWMSYFSGKGEKSDQRITGNSASISLNEVVEGFALIPPRKTLGRPKIKKVTLTGLSMGHFSDACDVLGDIEDFRSSFENEISSRLADVQEKELELDTYDQKKAELDEVVSTKNIGIAELNDKIEVLTGNQANLTANIESSNANLSNVELKVQQAEDILDKKQLETKTLNSEIESNSKKLQGLKENINLFPTEIIGYVNQGGKNIGLFTLLAFIPLAIILSVTVAVFFGTVDLTVKYSKLDDIDLYTMLGSRIPFIIVTLGILTVSYKICQSLISEVINIQKRRLNLTKISIVAKDVSDAAIVGLDLDDEEIYELRTKLKMSILKSHLSNDLAKDYDYNLPLGLWDKFELLKQARRAKINASSSSLGLSGDIELGISEDET